MIISLETLKTRIRGVVLNKGEQGYEIDGMISKLESLPESYDKLLEFASELSNLPISSEWPYVEPNDLEDIWIESDPSRNLKTIGSITIEESTQRVESAFLGSVAGCILGKPLEASFTGHEIRDALKAMDEWPLDNYVSKKIKNHLPRVNNSFSETAREYIQYVAPDDDINYTIMGMLILEEYGPSFTHINIQDLWLKHLNFQTTFGPERTTLLRAGTESLDRFTIESFLEKGGIGPRTPLRERSGHLSILNDYLNPGDELCGAAIRADAYGYACPGRPQDAANMAWKDASFTHSRTGIYGTMFIASAIAAAQVTSDRIGIFETALQYIPQKSRFYERVSACLEVVNNASSWEEAYDKISDKYGEYGHCRIYQETGMLINTLKFAENIGHGICIQVSQGADTDSFGATAGSLLGAYFGPGYLDNSWIEPFGDDIHSGMAWFFERSLSTLAVRMGQLPKTIMPQLSEKV